MTFIHVMKCWGSAQFCCFVSWCCGVRWYVRDSWGAAIVQARCSSPVTSDVSTLPCTCNRQLLAGNTALFRCCQLTIWYCTNRESPNSAPPTAPCLVLALQGSSARCHTPNFKVVEMVAMPVVI
ncbi:hypothetical protein O9929_14570 [Vibrio lentus]|nr:hypothetical protein [Vibrio lentus]